MKTKEQLLKGLDKYEPKKDYDYSRDLGKAELERKLVEAADKVKKEGIR